MSDKVLVSLAVSLFRALASLKVAIPLLVLIAIISTLGTLFPQQNIFQSNWYLGLLGLLGVCLLCATIDRIPSILTRKGRAALFGIVATHIGVLILLVGYIYGELDGFRYTVRAIEGEMTVVPGLPFVIKLDELVVKEYPAETFQHLNLEQPPRKQQDSRLSLFKNGDLWLQDTASPGYPMDAEGITLLPSLSDIGWCFEVLVSDPLGRESTALVRPWATPLIRLGARELMVHKLPGEANHQIEIFALVDNRPQSMGLVNGVEQLTLDGYTIRLGEVKRYTALFVYQRPQMVILFAGCFLTMAGLLWHFYYRNRTLKSEER